MAEMSTSREQLFNQAPLVSLHLLKIIADDFKAQGKVGESPDCFRELFHRIRRCPLLLQSAWWLLELLHAVPCVCTTAYPTSPLPGAVLSHCDLGSCRWQYGFLLIYLKISHFMAPVYSLECDHVTSIMTICLPANISLLWLFVW